MIRVGVVGYGYWGPHLVRNFHEAEGSRVTHVIDVDPTRLINLSRHYPTINSGTDANRLLADPEIDAVAIATPVSTHFELARRALEVGKHVLVEKPLSDKAQHCEELIDLAQKRGLVLMVDHTFPYTGAVRKIKELIDMNRLGEIYYYDSTRVNLGFFQRDVSVVWDLAVHDLSIVDYLFEERPAAISATGATHIPGQHENAAFLTLFFESGMTAHINVNWLAPVKVRQTLIGGSKKMILYNDLEPTEKIKVYDRGVTFASDPATIHEMRVGYRTGDMRVPKVDATEALALLARHFTSCIERGESPITDGESGLRVVRMMEAASASIESRGETAIL